MFRKKIYTDPDGVFEQVKIIEENAKIEELKKNKKLQKLRGNLRLVNKIRKWERDELLPELR